MPYKKFIQVGRVIYIAHGRQKGKLAVIVDIIDGNRALIDGPCTKVPRQEYKFAYMQLTKFVLNIQHSTRTNRVRKAWKDAAISAQWKKTQWAKNLHKKELRSSLNDYDRFKLGKAKTARNKIIKQVVKFQAIRFRKARRNDRRRKLANIRLNKVNHARHLRKEKAKQEGRDIKPKMKTLKKKAVKSIKAKTLKPKVKKVAKSKPQKEAK